MAYELQVPVVRELEKKKLSSYRRDKTALAKLIRRNVVIKSNVVEKDEFERGERRLLNFGHTLGHAISIGMAIASLISEEYTDFKDTDRVIGTLKQYGLPTQINFDVKEIMNVLRMDKKKVRESMNYIMLNKIGQGVVKTIPIVQIDKLLQSIITAR